MTHDYDGHPLSEGESDFESLASIIELHPPEKHEYETITVCRICGVELVPPKDEPPRRYVTSWDWFGC